MEISPTDFEFINMSGKQASVSCCKDNFEWDGRAVRELSGSGSIYVRLTKCTDLEEVQTISSDDDDMPLPVGPFQLSSGSDAPATSTSNDLSSSHTANSDLSSHTVSSSPPSLQPLSSNESVRPTPTPICIECDDACPVPLPDEAQQNIPQSSTTPISKEGNPFKGLATLQEIFPYMPASKLNYIYTLSSCLFSQAVDFLLGPCSFSLLRNLACDFQITTTLEESPRIRLEADDDEEDWVAAALAFYKQSKFDTHAALRVSIRGQPAIDAGGVRRQFFSVVFSLLAKPSANSLFEGAPCRLRPAFKASSLSSGMLSTLGKMIGHSILLDGQGFPYLSEFCYHYLSGNENCAITYKHNKR